MSASLAKIMVVEDESIVAKDLELTLKRLGYIVPATASSSDDAWILAAQHRPDLVLMDVHIKGAVDGIATARRMRREMNIPVIYLTAYADDDTVARARETEPFGYLIKPFNERELKSMLEVALYKHESEARLRHNDRMISIGTMAAGVAHEINNPLTYVMANLDFALKSMADMAADLGALSPAWPGSTSLLQQLRSASSALGDVLNGADRMRKIVADLGRFARPEEPARSAVDLWESLEAAIRLSSHQIKHHALIVREPGATPPVHANAQRLEQVFINILVNAVQAMPDGRPQANRIRVVTRTDGEGRAVVEIEDTGAGISAEVQARMFDPFFTTKPVGLGTGLGLSICHRIITDTGGTIAVESALGRGTLVRITLPAAHPKPAVPPQPASVREGATPRAQILVIDDEAKVLSVLDRILSRRHDVTLASDGVEALALIAGGRRFDLILCDLMMPRMTGMELFDRVKESAPDQADAFVFLSGGAVTERGAAFLEEHADRRFDKPFQLDALEEMIATRLAEEKE